MNRPTDKETEAAMNAYHLQKHRLTLKDVQTHEIFIAGFIAGLNNETKNQ